MDGSPPGSPIPGILQARTLEWVAISFSIAWKWKVKVKSLGRVRLLATPWAAAHQAPPSMGFSRQEYWSGVPLPSPTKYSYLEYIKNSQDSRVRNTNSPSRKWAKRHEHFARWEINQEVKAVIKSWDNGVDKDEEPPGQREGTWALHWTQDWKTGRLDGNMGGSLTGCGSHWIVLIGTKKRDKVGDFI